MNRGDHLPVPVIAARMSSAEVAQGISAAIPDGDYVLNRHVISIGNRLLAYHAVNRSAIHD